MLKTFFNGLILTISLISISYASETVEEKKERIQEIANSIQIGFENSIDTEFVFDEKDNINYQVIYFFSYGCPHCYNFKKYLEEWNKNKKEDVNIHYVPVTFQKGWENLAKGYLISKELKLNNFDNNIFNYIHRDENRINNMEDLRDFFNEIYNIESSIFNTLYNSIEVNMKIEEINKITDDFNIMGTPSLLLITKKGHSYLTSPSISQGDLSMIFTMEYLMMKDRKLSRKITQN